MNNGNVFQHLIAATFPVGGYQMHWLELIGILIGAASAYLGMKRWVWAWPVWAPCVVASKLKLPDQV